MKHLSMYRAVLLLSLMVCCLFGSSAVYAAEQNLTTYYSEEQGISFEVQTSYRVTEDGGYIWVYPGEDYSNFRITWVSEEYIDKEVYFQEIGDALREALGDSLIYDPGTESEPIELAGISMDAMIYAYTDAESNQTIEGVYLLEERNGYVIIYGAAYTTDGAGTSDAVLSALTRASRTFAFGDASAQIDDDADPKESLEDTVKILSELYAGFSEATTAFSKAYRTSVEEGGSDISEEMLAYRNLCEETLADTEEAEETLQQNDEAFSDSAGAFSCKNALLSCSIARKLLTFYIGYYDSSEPLGEYQQKASQGEYASEVESLNGMYQAMRTVQRNYKAIEYPESMQQVWPLYIDLIDAFCEKLYADYKAYAYDDTLMAASAQQLLLRQPYQMLRCENFMYSVLELQFDDLSSLLMRTESDELQIRTDYSAVSEIYPNLYPSMDSAVNLIMNTSLGSARVLVEAEIDGFSQKYQQTVTLTPELSFLMIKPPTLSTLTDLNSERTTQLTLRVTDLSDGSLLLVETKNITLHSIYDFTMMNTEFAMIEPYNLLAWLRPDADEILTLRREAISWLETNMGAGYNSLPGYQLAYPEGVNEGMTTAMQVMAIQAALSETGVRYNVGAYSFGGSQRVLTPDKVIGSRSGICIETALLMASALQSMDMHAMLLILPGHAQVAVETWTNSGQYFLIETTKLPYSGSESDTNALIGYYTSEEWEEYLSEEVTYVIDCDLARTLGIRGLAYGAAR